MYDSLNMHSLESSLIDIMRAEQDPMKGKVPFPFFPQGGSEGGDRVRAGNPAASQSPSMQRGCMTCQLRSRCDLTRLGGAHRAVLSVEGRRERLYLVKL